MWKETMECLDCQFTALGLADIVDNDEKLTHVVSGRAGNFIIYNQIFVYQILANGRRDHHAHVFFAAIVSRHIAYNFHSLHTIFLRHSSGVRTFITYL